MFGFRRDILFYQVQDGLLYWLVIPVTVIGSGLALDHLFHLRPLAATTFNWGVAGLLLTAGLVLISLSTRDLRVHGHGTPNKRQPARTLVTKGTYALCRHPMFLGYDCMGLGIGLLLRSKGMLFLSFPLFLLVQTTFLLREEQLLAKKFRRSFPSYKKKIPFLIPLTNRKTK